MVIVRGSKDTNDLHEKRDIELRILSASRAGDFALERVLGNGDNGVVVSAKCTRRGLPFPNKLYAVKILFNDSALRTRDIRDAFENEWEILSRIRTHPHIIRYWSQFVDVVPEPIARQSKHPVPNIQSQFVIMDYHENNFGRKRSHLPTPLPINIGMKYCLQLADGIVFLKSQGVLHLDLKPDNVLLSDNDDIVICDFGCAQQFDTESMRQQLARGQPPGGNPAHLSPEVLNEFFRVQRGGMGPAVVSYFRQTEWAYGCMVHEMIRNCHPFPEYPVRYGRPIQYYDRQIPSLPTSYPQEFQFIVRQLLSYEPTTRPSIKEAFGILTSCHQKEGEYNVQELQRKVTLLTDRCQSAERERKEARRERDDAVTQLQQLISELNAVRSEREAVNHSLERLKKENELANKNVSQLRLEQERDKRELTALRRERDVAQTLINQLRASRDNPDLYDRSTKAVVNKWTSKSGGEGPIEGGRVKTSPAAAAAANLALSPPATVEAVLPPSSSASPSVGRRAATAEKPGQESGYVSRIFGGAPNTPGTTTSTKTSRKKWGRAEIPNSLASTPFGGALGEGPTVDVPAGSPGGVGGVLAGMDGAVRKPPGSPRRASNAILKCKRCNEDYRESENHVGACRWHPGKVTVIDWGWMKVNVWDCCNETEGAGAVGCRGRAHMADPTGSTPPHQPPNTGTRTLAVHT